MSTTVKHAALGWISVRHLQHMIARGEAAGLRMDEILGSAGLDKARLDDSDGLVPLTAVEGMLAALSRRYADPLLGLHLACDIQPATFGAIGYISQACTTFGEVLEALTRFNGLLSNIGQTTVRHGPGTVQVCWECSAGGEAFRRHATEYVLGAFTVIARLLAPEKKDLLVAVNFSHARLPKPEQVRGYFNFFRCPVYFDQPVSSVIMPASLLHSKMHHSDAFVKDLLERHAAALLQQREEKKPPLGEEVKQLIAAMYIAHAPSKESVAQQLGISERSLARRLLESGTSYRELLDAVRLDIAHRRLRDSADPISELSDYLGFNSAQALIRWFKHLTGQTPGDFRKTSREGVVHASHE